MSYKLVDQVHRTTMPDLTHVEKAVLAYMATHADDDGSGVFCGKARIAEKTNLGTRTVERAVAELRRKGNLVEAGWKGRKRAFDIRLTGGSPDDTRLTGGSTSANDDNDIRLSDPLSSKRSDQASDHLNSRSSRASSTSTRRGKDSDIPEDWNIHEPYWDYGWRQQLSRVIRNAGLVHSNGHFNAAGKKAVGLAMRNGYGLRSIATALRNAGEGLDKGRSFTVPWILHWTKIDRSIEGDFDEDWHEVNPFERDDFPF
jgi:hypothetical protein